ncbi:Raffinose operon repressor [Tritonibacter multivorans]|uniref:Raffinose operon repressor n=1 Tax=Tritonibacter multivorans TaxID=928856 RepID=A0A0P1GXI9_9RHOB|nr:substrate-binding domain-containing protein [Tritonibacter multivorans]MDA7421108.1 substrate-binding domain-containing protein [Tritonibacter multivorans]CUH80158.1 Raffinose operon repressor [Tritonibacter multivorans]SFC74988.1 transcriptional regulator, LacI family [Tritonibacter multivorans]
MNLKELSELLGLSQTTVSRALNGYPEVSEKTRIRVVEAAREHNYSPNSRATGLATGRAMVIGHVIPLSARHEIVNPVFGDFVAGALQTYSQNNYDMMFAHAVDGGEAEIYKSLYNRRVVDGVVLQGPKVVEPRIKALRDLGIPFVVHGRSSAEHGPYPWVDVDNTRSFRRATEFLIDLGHRRIALINGLEDMDFAMRRRKGYEDAMAAANLPLNPDLMFTEEMTEVAGHHAARDMLRMETPPTAFMVSSMISAIGVRRAIEEAGLKMARDVSVIAHDDDLSYLKNGQDVPIFTATRSSVRHAGEIAAQILIDRINNPQLAPQTRMLEAEIVVGRSTGPGPER